jgi:hypothetical protein
MAINVEPNRYSGNTVLYRTGTNSFQGNAKPGQLVPHIASIRSGYELMDPVHKSIFEVTFTVPKIVNDMLGSASEDVAYLTQQVTTVAGLDALNKTTGAGTQKFLGVDVSYLNPVMESTVADLTINFNLNLRMATDNWVLRIFRIWASLNYDLSDGSRAIKADYCAPALTIAEANRNGDVWRSYQFNHVMLTGVSQLDDLDYSSPDARQLSCTFRSDFWYDTLAGPSEGVNPNIG